MNIFIYVVERLNILYELIGIIDYYFIIIILAVLKFHKYLMLFLIRVHIDKCLKFQLHFYLRFKI